MQLTDSEVRRATGYKLSRAQVDGMDTIAAGRSGAVHARTVQALVKRGMAMVCLAMPGLSDGDVTVTHRVQLTAQGRQALRWLGDACEYGADMAERARLAGRITSDLHYECLDNDRGPCATCGDSYTAHLFRHDKDHEHVMRRDAASTNPRRSTMYRAYFYRRHVPETGAVQLYNIIEWEHSDRPRSYYTRRAKLYAEIDAGVFATDIGVIVATLPTPGVSDAMVGYVAPYVDGAGSMPSRTRTARFDVGYLRERDADLSEYDQWAALALRPRN